MKVEHPVIANLTIHELSPGRWRGTTVPHIGLTLSIETYNKNRVIPGLLTMLKAREIIDGQSTPPGDYSDGEGTGGPQGQTGDC
jgi:hypothetical protein